MWKTLQEKDSFTVVAYIIIRPILYLIFCNGKNYPKRDLFVMLLEGNLIFFFLLFCKSLQMPFWFMECFEKGGKKCLKEWKSTKIVLWNHRKQKSLFIFSCFYISTLYYYILNLKSFQINRYSESNLTFAKRWHIKNIVNSWRNWSKKL